MQFANFVICADVRRVFSQAVEMTKLAQHLWNWNLLESILSPTQNNRNVPHIISFRVICNLEGCAANFRLCFVVDAFFGGLSWTPSEYCSGLH